MTKQSKDVVVEGVTMSYLGNDLLERTTLKLLHRKRYGLISRNGLGKSTLLSRISSKTLPGFPSHLKTALVSQELPDFSDCDLVSIDYLLQSNVERNHILQKISNLEELCEDEGSSDSSKKTNDLDKLLELYEQLEDEEVLKSRIISILLNLGLTHKMMSSQPVSSLSGGWRKRLSIAAALITTDLNILMLDEPTNHLDLVGIEWLQTYLNSPLSQDITVLIVSHDRQFLDDVCTDIIRLHQKKLFFYPGIKSNSYFIGVEISHYLAY